MLVCVASVVAYFGLTKPAFPQAYLGDTNVRCLPQTDEPLDVDWKATLAITVDGDAEVLPINIGNTIRCTAELHTKQGDGTIYIRLYNKDRLTRLSFADFFSVWGIATEREGYSLTIHVNGIAVTDLSQVALTDNMKVALYYISLPPEVKDEDEVTVTE